MNVLLIGNGGREHAIAAALVASPQVDRLYVAPGNGGTARLRKCENVAIDADALDAGGGAFDALLAFAQEHQVELTIVGPEAPLAEGVVDHFQAAGLKIFGPTRAAAQLEASKAFSKQFMLRHNIPTGAAEIFDDFDEAMRFLRKVDVAPIVKASGLAAGKGVLLPRSREGAAESVRAILVEGRFGDAGKTILLEERLTGPEVSVLAFTDGRSVRVMPPAQDHKRQLDGDRGPNTGGMGAFAPSKLLTTGQIAEIERTILLPTVAGMASEGTPYVGVLYAGLMLTAQGPKVLEFNCRFGDPETQAILPLLESDLLAIFLACLDGTLDQVEIRWRDQAAVTVVMAAQGYPGQYPSGHEITGIERAEDAGCRVYLAGARYKEKRLLTAGGRVLAVTGLGNSIEEAADRAYNGVKKVHFNEAQYRQDIGRPLPPQPKKPRPARKPIKRR